MCSLRRVLAGEERLGHAPPPPGRPIGARGRFQDARGVPTVEKQNPG